jgi:hypothetical protein
MPSLGRTAPGQDCNYRLAGIAADEWLTGTGRLLTAERSEFGSQWQYVSTVILIEL